MQLSLQLLHINLLKFQTKIPKFHIDAKSFQLRQSRQNGTTN
jgi:hypothetical protein